jgi:hypothetical protein
MNAQASVVARKVWEASRHGCVATREMTTLIGSPHLSAVESKCVLCGSVGPKATAG